MSESLISCCKVKVWLSHARLIFKNEIILKNGVQICLGINHWVIANFTNCFQSLLSS